MGIEAVCVIFVFVCECFKWDCEYECEDGCTPLRNEERLRQRKVVNKGGVEEK